jgi:hypothetical protein
MTMIVWLVVSSASTRATQYFVTASQSFELYLGHGQPAKFRIYAM